MSEEERDDLFANVKLLLDEVVATPERSDRAVKAAALLLTLGEAFYGPNKPDESDEDDEDDVSSEFS